MSQDFKYNKNVGEIMMHKMKYMGVKDILSAF